MNTKGKFFSTICIFTALLVIPLTTALADTLTATPSWTGESNVDGSQFGVSVNTAGDVNGDGYDDVIVGGFGGDGLVHVYYGSETGPSASPDWVAGDGQWASRFGVSG